MLIVRHKLDRVLAEQCKNASDLRFVGFSPATIHRIRSGGKVNTKTAGRLAKALNVPLDRLLEAKEVVDHDQ